MILKKTRNMGPLHKSVHALIDLRQPPPSTLINLIFLLVLLPPVLCV